MADPYVTDQELLKLVQAARLPGDVAVRLGALLRAAGGGTGPAGPPGPTGATGATGPAGAGFADGDYGDISISGSVTALTVDNDVVTNAKMANMAESTIKGRAVGAGTGDPTDLTGAQAAAIIGAVTTSGLPFVFCYGYDGALTYDGTTTILGVVPSGNTYTLSRDVFATSLTIDSGVTIRANNFRIWCTGTLTNNGTIHNSGANANNATQGAGVSAQVFAATAAGGAGPNGANGQTGSNVASNPQFPNAATNSAALGGAIAGNGSNGPVMFRGGGGGGAATLRTGGTGGTVTIHSAAAGGPAFTALMRGVPDNASGRYTAGSGGGSGGGPAVGSGGGGGAGAGILFVIAQTIAGTGAFQANGGNGGIGNGNGTGTGGGGGGGGGGGVVVLAYCTRTGSTTTSVTGGTGGAGNSGGGAGGNGADGYVALFNLSGDGT